VADFRIARSVRELEVYVEAMSNDSAGARILDFTAKHVASVKLRCGV